jgi:hypothetical protein
MAMRQPGPAGKTLKIVQFAEKPTTAGCFLYWRGGTDRLMSAFGTLRSRSLAT